MDNDIHNWYEQEVIGKLSFLARDDQSLHEELLSDVACVALNNLPARYIRHTVDVSFYTSREERVEMDDKVNLAINNAFDYVRSHPNFDNMYGD